MTAASSSDRPGDSRGRRRAGMRRGVPFGFAVFAIAISFGVLARPVMGWVAPIVMSVVVFSGAAQFGALAVLNAGGGTGAAIAAALGGAAIALVLTPLVPAGLPILAAVAAAIAIARMRA